MRHKNLDFNLLAAPWQLNFDRSVTDEPQIIASHGKHQGCFRLRAVHEACASEGQSCTTGPEATAHSKEHGCTERNPQVNDDRPRLGRDPDLEPALGHGHP